MDVTPDTVCLADLGLFSAEEVGELEALFYSLEHTIVDLLIWEEGDMISYLRFYSRPDCLALLELRLRGCGESAKKVLSLADWPEVSKIAIEGACVEALVRPSPPAKVRSALNKLGIKPVPIAYRAPSEGA